MDGLFEQRRYCRQSFLLRTLGVDPIWFLSGWLTESFILHRPRRAYRSPTTRSVCVRNVDFSSTFFAWKIKRLILLGT